MRADNATDSCARIPDDLPNPTGLGSVCRLLDGPFLNLDVQNAAVKLVRHRATSLCLSGRYYVKVNVDPRGYSTFDYTRSCTKQTNSS